MHGRGRRPLSDVERQAAQELARRQHHLDVAKAISAQQQQQQQQQRRQQQPSQEGAGLGTPARQQEGAWNDVEQRKQEALAGSAESAAPYGPVGTGAFAVVRVATGPDGKQVAIKTYNPQGDPIAQQHLQNEIALAGRIRHPNIIGPGTVTKLGGERVQITMDYADSGSLSDYIKRAKYGKRDVGALPDLLPEIEGAALFIGIVDAVLYLHSCELSHGDLKLANAMLDRGIVRLIDFGTVRHEGTRAEREGAAAPLAGTIPYLAPEALPQWSEARRAWRTLSYDGRPADVWALGVLLVNLLSRGEFPFVGRDEEAVRAAITSGRPKLPERLSDAARGLIESMLTKDPAHRPLISKVRAHPWVALADAAGRGVVASADPMVATNYSAAFAHLPGGGGGSGRRRA